jgi:cell wall-associated NlpC family hydrolase
VPASWEVWDRQAASAECPNLSWSVLAAIGERESDSGQSSLPGVTSGSNSAGAEGPLQFEPATFAAYAVVGPDGATPPSPYDPVDAIYTAARMLCADGASSLTGTYGAVFAYDHTDAYVEEVLVMARALSVNPDLGTVAARALQFGASQLGEPYLWGGTGTGGWDCSGLVQAAYRSAGVTLPRVAQTQMDAGPLLAAASAPQPGDLMFFGSGLTGIDHVGMYLGTGLMIDAPYTGTVVRVDQTPTEIGGALDRTLFLVGVTAPGR